MSEARIHVDAFLDEKTLQLYFCRGPKKCSQPDRETRKVRCPDCFTLRDDQTVGDAADKIERGEA